MTEKKNNLKRNVIIAGIIISIAISLIVFSQAQVDRVENKIDSKISKHPKIVTMEVNQKNIEDALKEIKEQLKEIDGKMNKLLMNEYP